MDHYLFFWRSSSPFSQWYPSRFAVDDIVYETMEQYMMMEKAKLFRDMAMYNKIRQTSNPRDIKRLGRQIRNFDQRVWDAHKTDIVYTGSIHKFMASEGMLQAILRTGDKILVEASPYDRIWGIGMSEDDPDIVDETKWRGQNLLGRCLMKARSTIRNLVHQ